MRGFSALLIALLILLLAAPATPVTVSTASPAGPDAPPVTFNVVRLGLYPEEESADRVFALGNVAFLADNHYDSSFPQDSYGNVELYDIADPQNPHFRREVSADTGRTISDMDSDGHRLALGLSLHSWYSSVGGLEVYDNVGKVCWFDFDYDTQGMAYSVALDDSSVYVGLRRGLALLSFDDADGDPCDASSPLFPSSSVYDIAALGPRLYLGQYDGVRAVNAINWPPSEVAFYSVPHPVYHVAVSDANYIYAATDYGLYIIDGASGQIVTHYLPNEPVTVAVDGSTAYVGTDDDLQVLDVSEPSAPKLIGDYADRDMDFERSLSFDSGLVHSPKGIFQYKPEPPTLLVEAQSAGVAVNSTPLASGSSVAVKGGDRITLLAPGSAATIKLRCSANSAPKPELGARQVLNGSAPELTTAVIDVVLDPILLGFWAVGECNKQTSLAPLLADPPALPLSLVFGGVQMQVPATAGAVKVDTPYAGSRAAAGTTFQTSHAPSSGVSRFVCLAGTLEVQPTAAGALPLTLGRDQFVNVTAAGAGLVGQLRYIYLPLVRR